MSLRILRTTCFAALTVVAIPYAVAMMTNILCGWPLCAKRYRRAFNPHKVFALNWALLLQLGKLRYVRLMIRCRNFYQNASRNRLLKVSICIKVPGSYCFRCCVHLFTFMVVFLCCGVSYSFKMYVLCIETIDVKRYRCVVKLIALSFHVSLYI